MIIESKHRNDYVVCACGAIAVDGGHDYLRRIGEPEHMIELAVYSEKHDDAPQM